MCSVMAAVGGLLTGLQGYAEYKAIDENAKAQRDMYNAQAQAAEQNAKIEGRRQEQIADNYGEEQRRLRARQRLAEGQLRAQTGAAGLDMSGSAMDILSSGQEAYTQDKLTLLSNQRNDNYESRVTQTNYLNEAQSHRASAQNVMAQARQRKNATILGTAASIVPFFAGIGGSGNSGTTSSTGSGTGWAGSMSNYTYKGTSGLTIRTPLRLTSTPTIRAVRR